jgi:methylase of polypeptide subunit release factors
MSCLPSAHASALSPKLTGTYEKEIQDDLLAIANTVNSFLDIGCAEGYYATGLALIPSISCAVGVDINNESLRAAQNLADLNKVSKKCFLRQE